MKLLHQKRALKVLLVVAVIVAAGGLAVFLLPPTVLRWYPPYNPDHPTAAQQKAINDAEAWRSEKGIISGWPTMTPAVDPVTGARHAFPDTDLPPGWIEERQ